MAAGRECLVDVGQTSDLLDISYLHMLLSVKECLARSAVVNVFLKNKHNILGLFIGARRASESEIVERI